MRLADFVGRWSIERSILDKSPNGPGRFAGEAVFALFEDGVRYEESGVLELGQGGSFRASRTYLWKECGGAIEICFSDGRFFHAFAADDDKPEATHLCGEDTYVVAYGFTHWPVWKSVWNVTGPRKDYRINTVFRPAGQLRGNEA